MDSNTARELSRKFNHTVSMIEDRDLDLIYPVFFDGFSTNEDGIHYCVVLHHKEHLNPNSPLVSSTKLLHRFDMLPMPDKQVFDSQGETRIYERFPNRQWQKGVCAGNTKLSSVISQAIVESLPRASWFEVKGRSKFSYDLSSLFNLFVPSYPKDFMEAIKEIKAKKLMSRALNKSYFLSLFPNEETQFVLYRFDVPVAYYNEGKDSFKLISKMYRQEIIDFCSRQQLDSKIEV